MRIACLACYAGTGTCGGVRHIDTVRGIPSAGCAILIHDSALSILSYPILFYSQSLPSVGSHLVHLFIFIFISLLLAAPEISARGALRWTYGRTQPERDPGSVTQLMSPKDRRCRQRVSYVPMSSRVSFATSGHSVRRREIWCSVSMPRAC
ncbi:hypothetical protein C8R44DRAFT_304695 [Mycena epipterygia]|nr:hypothetical protein C8R44DRAFT_304695 [Mycena epipterygia]